MINSEKIYIGYQQLFDDQWPKSIADALLNEVIQNREIQKNFKKQCKPGLYIRKIRNRGEVHFRRNALNREFREALEKTNLFWEIKEKQKRKTPTSLRKNSLSRSQEERWDKCGLHPPEFLIGIHITLRPSPKDQNTIGCSILLEVTNIEKGTSN